MEGALEGLLFCTLADEEGGDRRSSQGGHAVRCRAGGLGGDVNRTVAAELGILLGSIRTWQVGTE